MNVSSQQPSLQYPIRAASPYTLMQQQQQGMAANHTMMANQAVMVNTGEGYGLWEPVFSLSDVLKHLAGLLVSHPSIMTFVDSLVRLVAFVTMSRVCVASLGMMTAGGPRPGMQQQLQEGWVGSAPPLGQSGPTQQGVMPGRIGANTAPMRATGQPRPMLQSPLMANGETCVTSNASLFTRYHIVKREDKYEILHFTVINVCGMLFSVCRLPFLELST